jgi:multiple antibiotic resistance protein
MKNLINLIILYFVIFDPLMSLSFFFAATKNMDTKQRIKTATLAIMVACFVSYTFLLFGLELLKFFSTTLEDFKIAGGIILCILGIKMALGQPAAEATEADIKSSRAIAAIIGTPLLTGPAAITSIIITSKDYGILNTAIAITIVLSITGVLFYQAARIIKLLGNTTIQVISTMLGLITLSWGIMFIRNGIQK